MMDAVAQTLKIWRSTDFERGSRDCLLSIADYVLLRDGVDHGAKYRGTYDDATGANEWIAREGGAVAMIDASGLSRVSKPHYGNIVVVRVGSDLIPGICTGDTAAFRMSRGVISIGLRFLKIECAWK